MAHESPPIKRSIKSKNGPTGGPRTNLHDLVSDPDSLRDVDPLWPTRNRREMAWGETKGVTFTTPKCLIVLAGFLVWSRASVMTDKWEECNAFFHRNRKKKRR